MTPAEVLAQIIDELQRVVPDTDADARLLQATHRRVARIIELLVGRGLLSTADLRLLEKYAATARPRVSLAVVSDKHATPSPDIDCASLLPICHGRCCSFRVTLQASDVREGKLRWELEDPYTLERGADGYCTHLRAEGGCERYADRPTTCREYDCRHDQRVWLDFERRIPAPMPPHVTPRY